MELAAADDGTLRRAGVDVHRAVVPDHGVGGASGPHRQIAAADVREGDRPFGVGDGKPDHIRGDAVFVPKAAGADDHAAAAENVGVRRVSVVNRHRAAGVHRGVVGSAEMHIHAAAGIDTGVVGLSVPYIHPSVGVDLRRRSDPAAGDSVAVNVGGVISIVLLLFLSPVTELHRAAGVHDGKVCRAAVIDDHPVFAAAVPQHLAGHDVGGGYQHAVFESPHRLSRRRTGAENEQVQVVAGNGEFVKALSVFQRIADGQGSERGPGGVFDRDRPVECRRAAREAIDAEFLTRADRDEVFPAPDIVEVDDDRRIGDFTLVHREGDLRRLLGLNGGLDVHPPAVDLFSADYRTHLVPVVVAGNGMIQRQAPPGGNDHSARLAAFGNDHHAAARNDRGARRTAAVDAHTGSGSYHRIARHAAAQHVQIPPVNPAEIAVYGRRVRHGAVSRNDHRAQIDGRPGRRAAGKVHRPV